MTRDCAINLDEIHTISKVKITDKMTTLSDDKMRAVDTAIKYALDLG
jgi:mRNA-degrading endonuclease toxin of MazEF toxin-antitoxin module